jgi:hypothetical protein
MQRVKITRIYLPLLGRSAADATSISEKSVDEDSSSSNKGRKFHWNVKTVPVPAVPTECECPWEGITLRAPQNALLRGLFTHKRWKVRHGRSELYCGELHSQQFSPRRSGNAPDFWGTGGVSCIVGSFIVSSSHHAVAVTLLTSIREELGSYVGPDI